MKLSTRSGEAHTPDSLRIGVRLIDAKLKVLDQSETPLATLVRSGALDLSKPGTLAKFIPKRPAAIVEAEGDRIVVDLMSLLAPRRLYSSRMSSLADNLPPSAEIAKQYAHQLTPEGLARLRLLVKGFIGSPKDRPEAKRNRVLAEADEVARELIGASAQGTYRAYCMKLWEEEAAEEKKWSHRTMNDALDSAFEALGRAGIVAVQDAGGNQSDGWAAVNEEIAEREPKRKVLGATFYHSQDLERALNGEGLWLTFGARDGSDAAGRAVAEKVMRALEAEGLECIWNGDVASRIHVTPFAWQKRRTTKAPRKQSSVPWRTFVHEDGREWRIAGLNNAVCLRIKDHEGDLVERRTPANDLEAEIGRLIKEQLVDGFVER